MKIAAAATVGMCLYILNVPVLLALLSGITVWMLSLPSWGRGTGKEDVE
jgi:hypothetical protein